MTDLARRYRAARAWADITQEQLAELLGVDVATIKRREAGTGDPKRAEQIALAHVCDVPAEFVLSGFATLGEPTRSELQERLEGLEGSVRFLVGRAADQPLEDLLAELTDETTRALLGLAGPPTGGAALHTGDEEDEPPGDGRALP